MNKNIKTIMAAIACIALCGAACAKPAPGNGDRRGDSGRGRGGGTAWLTTSAPVQPGQVFNLDFYIWDTGDSAFDSTVIIDNFRWTCSAQEVSTGYAQPGT